MALEEKYVNPFTDFGFKKLFGSEPNKDLLIDFLNQVLPQRHKIKELTHSPTEQLGVTSDDRKAIFDLYCIGENGDRFIVEMQKSKQNFFKDRSVFYSSFPIQEQAKKGEWDFRLAAVYLVGILDFIFSEDKAARQVRHEVQLKDEQCQVFYDKLTYIYLEMPNFNKKEEELQSNFDKWMYVLKQLPRLEKRPAALQERVFQKLFETAEIARFTPMERKNYEQSLKYYRDMKNVLDTSFEEGRTRGREEGKEEGREEGRTAGEAMGRAAEKAAIASQMKSNGMDFQLISRLTGLTVAEIEKL